MELLWLYYKGLKSSRYMLFLQLGTRSGKICGLDADKISDIDRRKIIYRLSDVSLESAISWLRDNCPLAYKTAYRELLVDRVRVQSRHQIDQSKVK